MDRRTFISHGALAGTTAATGQSLTIAAAQANTAFANPAKPS